MQDIYIYGCGGVGNELAEYLLNSSDYHLLGFIDDNPEIRKCMGIPSCTFEELVSKEIPENIGVIISIGEPALREIISDKIAAKGINELTVDLSDHFNAKYSTVEKGTLLHVNSYISVNATIGRCCMINKGVLVGHDCTVGKFCVISPRVTLGGDVRIGDGSYIGTAAVIRNGITIGKNVIIGMGAVIVKDVEDDVVVVGNPGRVIRKNESRRVFKHN